MPEYVPEDTYTAAAATHTTPSPTSSADRESTRRPPRVASQNATGTVT